MFLSKWICVSHGVTAAKVGLTFTEDGDAIRISKATGHVIPWPDPPKYLMAEEVGCGFTNGWGLGCWMTSSHLLNKNSLDVLKDLKERIWRFNPLDVSTRIAKSFWMFRAFWMFNKKAGC